MYAIKLYTHLHKQGCDFLRWLTILSGYVCAPLNVCVCVSVCALRELSCSGCILTFDLC